MYPRKISGNEFRFVRLQPSDEMPFDVASGERWDFGDRLLHDVLTEHPLAGTVRLADEFGRMRFGNSDEFDVFRPTTRATSGGGDRIANAQKIVGDVIHTRMLTRRTSGGVEKGAGTTCSRRKGRTDADTAPD